MPDIEDFLPSPPPMPPDQGPPLPRGLNIRWPGKKEGETWSLLMKRLGV